MKDVLWISGIVVMLVIITLAGNIFLQGDEPTDLIEGAGAETPGDGNTQFKTFNSFSDITDFINESKKVGGEYYSYPNLYCGQYYRDYNSSERSGRAFPACDMADSNPAENGLSDTSDYSTTNIQEEGVDEGDVVKNDGGYAYIVSSDCHQVFIVDVFPPESSNLVSKIGFDKEFVDCLYLNGDRLVVISTSGNQYNRYWYENGYGYYSKKSDHGIRVKIYDITIRSEPVLFKMNEFPGYLIDSRMIEEQLYLIGRQYDNEVISPSDLPVRVEDVQYIDRPDNRYCYTIIASLDITKKDGGPLSRAMLIGYSSEIYVSERNIYVTHTAYGSWADLIEVEIDEVLAPILPEKERTEIERSMALDSSLAQRLDMVDGTMERYLDKLSDADRDHLYDIWKKNKESFVKENMPYQERTAIHRISLIGGSINFKASGTVPGYILNRFSMGEYQGYFRLATTVRSGTMWGGWYFEVSKISNNVFVLDMDLKIIGNITGIAPKESIYSARFMGERAYLVTFEKVDPFFVIDLSDPKYPKILGELKIPGYSDYLHPYDKNHVIGLGKDTVEAEGGDFSWYQGVKLSLFDVTDMNNPKEISKFIIGQRGTYSLAQDDPHAFLFSLNKNLLVIPIALYEVTDPYPEPDTYGEFVWTGAYVFEVSTDRGFVLKGRISNSETDVTMDDYYEDHKDSIYRSFYIEETIYTISPMMVKASEMGSLKEVFEIYLPNNEA